MRHFFRQHDGVRGCENILRITPDKLEIKDGEDRRIREYESFFKEEAILVFHHPTGPGRLKSDEFGDGRIVILQI